MNHSHSLDHNEIQRLIDAALDQPLDAQAQATLDHHLAECAECRRYAARLQKLEARLGPALESRWPPGLLSDGQRASFLGKIQSHTRRTPMQTRISGSVRALALGMLAILLIIALGWGVRTLRPVMPAGGGGKTPAFTGGMPAIIESTPSTPTGETTGQTPSVPSSTPTMETIILTPPPTQALPTPPALTATPAPTISGSTSLFPRVQFTFAAEFPAAPNQVVVYQQLQSEPITVDLARQAAASLGVSGEVVEYMGEGGWPIYEVHGGGSVVRFLGYADQFMYEVTPSAELSNSTQLLPFEQQVVIAEDFLRQKGLLEGDYHVEPIQSDPGVVRFVQQLDGHEVRYGVGENRMGSTLQWIEVSLNADGEVATVAYNAHNFQQVGKYPVLAAQLAWERFSASPTGNYGMYAVVAAEQPVTYRSWTRDYPAGTVHIYDYAASLPSAEGGAPVVQFSRFPLVGNVQNMETGKFLHAWGQILLDEQGHKTFQVEGWELSTLADNYLSGTIQRAGDSATLQTEDGQWLAIPDLPADVPEGEKVNVRGVILNGSLDWSYIDTGDIPGYYGYSLSCGGGGGGGSQTPEANFGGSSLARLFLGGLGPVPTQPVPPYQAGDTLDGQIGNVWVTLNKYGDRTETTADLWVEAADGTVFVAHLAGTGLSGIEQYNAIPIKVWGHVVKADSSEMYFTVDRFEEAYPGLHIQAWIGKEEAVTLDGKDVLVFTSLDGQQYVLKNSIGYGDQARVGLPGDTVIREGLLIPGLTFGGYPVIQELAGQMANGQTDLSGYTVMSSQPTVYDHTQEQPYVAPESVIQGQVSIDQIELVYLAYSLAGCPAEAGTYNPEMTYVQPVWRFRGQFEDGRRFEVLLQALTDSNLTFGMPGG
jgi:hypothetical protein